MNIFVVRHFWQHVEISLRTFCIFSSKYSPNTSNFDEQLQTRSKFFLSKNIWNLRKLWQFYSNQKIKLYTMQLWLRSIHTIHRNVNSTLQSTNITSNKREQVSWIFLRLACSNFHSRHIKQRCKTISSYWLKKKKNWDEHRHSRLIVWRVFEQLHFEWFEMGRKIHICQRHSEYAYNFSVLIRNNQNTENKHENAALEETFPVINIWFDFLFVKCFPFWNNFFFDKSILRLDIK